MDTVIRNVHVPHRRDLVEVGIHDGRIAAIEPRLAERAGVELDGREGLLAPAFADCHTHLDKTMLADGRGEYPTLGQAIAAFDEYCANALTKEDVKRRARRMLELALSNGTLYVRTHCTFWGPTAMPILEALLEVREEYANRVEVQVFPMIHCYGGIISAASEAAMHEAAKLPISGFDSSAHMSTNPEAVVDTVLDICARYNLAADFHVDETDLPDIRSLKHICKRMEETPAWHGRVAAGHICALAAVDDGEAAETVARMAAAGLSAIVMASCNLYLMGRSDRQPVRRGITRVREMLDAGVNVACASDNVRDYFRPFGNADVLEEALITAQVAQLGTPSQLRRVFDMATVNAANVMGIEGYGVEKGCRADLVLLEAPDPALALLGQANKRFVMKNGRIICENRRETVMHKDA